MTLRVILAIILPAMAMPTAFAWEHVSSDSYKFIYHCRFASHPGGSFGIRIAGHDTTEWRAVTVRIPDVDIDDIFNRGEVNIIFSHKTTGAKERTDSAIRIPFIAGSDRFPELSLRLRSYNDRATIEFGEKESVYRSTFTVDNTQPVSLEYTHDKKTRTIRHTLHSTLYPVISQGPFGSIDSLKTYTAASENIYEGLWRYYDRSFNQFRVPDEGRYNIATIKTDDGYKIIYLSTDDNIPTRLKPLDIKGSLDDSGFDGIFNLQWLDAQGWPADRYASAQFEGNLLTLRFPTLDVILRFARVKQNDDQP